MTSQQQPPVRVLVVDDQQLIRDGIASLLGIQEGIEELVISEGTVKNHVSNILTCLGLRDRTQAAIYAREKNLI